MEERFNAEDVCVDMYYLFVDEIKENRKDYEFYGLSAVLINNTSYQRFKTGFYKALSQIGWNQTMEIKGRYCFSRTKGDTDVSVEDRLVFVEELFELSQSGSGKYASAKCYYALDIFIKGQNEEVMYSDLLSRIVNKLPKNSKSNKNGNNNVLIFLDNNDAVNVSNVSKVVKPLLEKRNLFMVERVHSVDSGNDTPGIIFADHLAYFISNYFKLSKFNKNTVDRVKELFNKVSNNKLNEKEIEEFNSYVISFKKEKTTIKLLSSVKKLVYVA